MASRKRYLLLPPAAGNDQWSQEEQSKPTPHPGLKPVPVHIETETLNRQDHYSALKETALLTNVAPQWLQIVSRIVCPNWSIGSTPEAT
jgi:hypothetical protein